MRLSIFLLCLRHFFQLKNGKKLEIFPLFFNYFSVNKMTQRVLKSAFIGGDYGEVVFF